MEERTKLELLQENSDAVREVIGKMPPSILKWGLTFLMVFIFSLISLSWFIKYPDKLPASITINAATPPISIIAESSGRVTLMVADHQKVSRGQILGYVENAASLSDVLLLKKALSQFIAAKADKNDLSLQSFKDNLNVGEIQPDFETFISEYNDYRYFLTNNDIVNEIYNDNQKLSYTKGLDKKYIQIDSLLNSDVQLKQKDFQRNKKLWEGKVLTDKEFEDAKRSLLAALKVKEDGKMNVLKNQSDIVNIRGDIDRLEKSLRIKKETYDIELMNYARKCMAGIADWENRYVFYSHIDGTVNLINIYKTEQYLDKGATAMVIAPADNSVVLGKAYLPAENLSKVRRGQKVDIKLSSHPFYEYGILAGTVLSISDVPDKDNKFIINVGFPNGLVTSYHKKITFNSTLQGDAMIVVDDTRLLERVFYSFRKQMTR